VTRLAMTGLLISVQASLAGLMRLTVELGQGHLFGLSPAEMTALEAGVIVDGEALELADDDGSARDSRNPASFASATGTYERHSSHGDLAASSAQTTDRTSLTKQRDPTVLPRDLSRDLEPGRIARTFVKSERGSRSESNPIPVSSSSARLGTSGFEARTRTGFHEAIACSPRTAFDLRKLWNREERRLKACWSRISVIDEGVLLGRFLRNSQTGQTR
jgi:hypothetical protein